MDRRTPGGLFLLQGGQQALLGCLREQIWQHRLQCALSTHHPQSPPRIHPSLRSSTDGSAKPPPLCQAMAVAPPPRASHICGCSIIHPLPRSCGADGGTQIPLSQGRALIAKPSRGVSPQLQHTAQLSSHRRRTLAPEAPGWREERESQVPPVRGAA